MKLNEVDSIANKSSHISLTLQLKIVRLTKGVSYNFPIEDISTRRRSSMRSFFPSPSLSFTCLYTACQSNEAHQIDISVSPYPHPSLMPFHQKCSCKEYKDSKNNVTRPEFHFMAFRLSLNAAMYAKSTSSPKQKKSIIS